MTTHEVLVGGRNRLDRDGWWRVMPGEGHCTATAVDGDGVDCVEFAEAIAALSVAIGVGGLPDIFIWNDAPERTKADVFAAYDKAIAATAPEPDTSFLSKPTRDPVPA